MELRDFVRAVDEHAIVSITDRRGVILHANDKFCAISGYSREELLGNTHRLLESGARPDTFDINLPGMSGYDVREVMRADARLAAIPVIAITASALPDEVKRVRDAGFDGDLAKPLAIRRFLERLDWHLSARSRSAAP